jgi:hypothetical protein
MTNFLLKSIFSETRSTSALELGIIDATWSGRCRNRLKNKTLMRGKILDRAPRIVQSSSEALLGTVWRDAPIKQALDAKNLQA